MTRRAEGGPISAPPMMAAAGAQGDGGGRAAQAVQLCVRSHGDRPKTRGKQKGTTARESPNHQSAPSIGRVMQTTPVYVTLAINDADLATCST